MNTNFETFKLRAISKSWILASVLDFLKFGQIDEGQTLGRSRYEIPFASYKPVKLIQAPVVTQSSPTAINGGVSIGTLNNVVAGDTLLLGFVFSNGNNATTFSFVESSGDTLVEQVSVNNASFGQFAKIFTVQNASAGTHTVTVTGSTVNAGGLGAIFFELAPCTVQASQKNQNGISSSQIQLAANIVWQTGQFVFGIEYAAGSFGVLGTPGFTFQSLSGATSACSGEYIANATSAGSSLMYVDQSNSFVYVAVAMG